MYFAMPMRVDSTAFDVFEGEPGIIKLNAFKLRKVISLAEESETPISIEVLEDTAELLVKFSNLERRLSLIDDEKLSAPKLPDITLPATIKTDASLLKLAVKATKDINDYLRLTATADSFIIENKV